jgi:two-component system phosphate regulon sensor histidine kinase PhoR
MWRSWMFWRLFGSFGALFLGSILLLGSAVVEHVEKYSQERIETSLRDKAVLLRESFRDVPPDQVPLLQARIIPLGRELATRITLLSEDGRVLADSEQDPAVMENHSDRPEVQLAKANQYGTATHFSKTLHQPMMYAALHVGPATAPAGDQGKAVAYVRVARSVDSVHNELARLRHQVWAIAAATWAATLLLAVWLARRFVQPLQALTRCAEHIAAGDYTHKVYVGGRDEFDTLARTFNHMSERLAAQFSQLEEDRQQLRTILGSMVEGVIALDAGQRILFANERAGELLEIKTQAAVGRKLWEVVRQRPLQQVVRRVLKGDSSFHEELVWNGPTAKSLTVHAARLPGTQTRGAVLVLHDTSELRRLERVRREFVANVSHELKTPLSVITACVETLIDGAADDPQHRGAFLERIAEQAERLHALILDLLSLARIESGEEAFVLQAVPLDEAVSACVERHRARAEAKNQVLEAGCQPLPDGQEVPAVAWADDEAVGQILDNLVDNAIKYTPPGGQIRIRWQAEERQVHLEVEDTGIGIPERDLPRIFERFYRVDKARSRELGGTGLGLSIVKHLVQAMHGTVSATSRPGQGTTFLVRLPRATTA